VQPIVWSVLGVPTQTGTIVGGSFQAKTTGASKIIASYQPFADTSNLVYVLPGAFAHFEFTGGPDSIVAGQAWTNGTNDVIATAHDLYENVNYEYNGQVYFRSSDPKAQLPYTAASPYTFVTGDQGRHAFAGSGFKLFSAGRQDVELMKGDTAMRAISGITVLAGAVNTYVLSTPDTVRAGRPFTTSISQAADSWENAVSGRVDVSLTSGNGVSPSGALPSLSSFFVSNGSGTGSLVLVKAGDETINFNLGGVIKSKRVRVVADSVSRFEFALDVLQPPGRAFVGTAQLTAFDHYGNVVSWFNALQDPVTVTSNGTGAMINGRIATASAFANGVCDLKTAGTGYSGSELYVTFTATSESGKQGTSPTIGFSFLKITSGSLAENTKYVGETFRFTLGISDFGNQAGYIDSLRLYVGGNQAAGIIVDRKMPDTVPALANRTFVVTGNVPSRPNELLAVGAKFFGRIGGVNVTDSLGNLDTLTVLPVEGVGLVAASLAPTVVTRGRQYAFSLSVFNNSGDALSLTTATTLNLTGATGFGLAAPVVVPAHGGLAVLNFVKGVIPDGVADTLAAISVHLIGNLGSVAFDRSFAVTTTVHTESPPAISYVPATLSPTVVFRGRDVVFALDLVNSGTAALPVDLSSAGLAIYSGNRSLTTSIDASQLSLPNGTTHVNFKTLFVPADFPTAVDSLSATGSGSLNGYVESFRVNIPGSAVAIPSGARVQLIGTVTEALHVPYVNTSQHFNIKVSISNQGDEPLKDVVIRLQSDGGSQFGDSILVGTIPIAAESTVTFAITADATARSSELFRANVTAATGTNSELPAQIIAPVNNTQVVVIQAPANLQLITGISSPPEAEDGTVKPSSSFILGASVANNGQATVSSGEVSLKAISGSFVLPSLLTHSFVVGQNIEWTITAPAFNDTAYFEIAISGAPTDSNTGSVALESVRTDTIIIVASEQQVAIGVNFTPAASTLLSAGGTYDVVTLTFDIVGKSEQPYLKYIEFALHDRAGQAFDPTTVVTAASLIYNSQTTFSGIVQDNRLRFNLGASSGPPEQAVLQIKLQPNPSRFDAVLYLDSNSIAAEYMTPGGAKPVPITARFASRLVIQQELTFVPQTLEQSFFSYPNPFSPVTGEATLVYTPTAAKPATLKIYTLTGEEVISRSIPAPVSTSEPVTVRWDGRNGDGHVVLNGVYIAVLAVEGMPEVRIKIAVVK
jgi:hypothetical protein